MIAYFLEEHWDSNKQVNIIFLSATSQRKSNKMTGDRIEYKKTLGFTCKFKKIMTKIKTD